MTLRAGGVTPGVIDKFAGSPGSARINQGHNGFLVTFPTGVFNITLYKNEGWYATGGVWEQWTTATSPSSTPPSGHTLTFVEYIVLQV
jgi:hypothetical protein